MKILIAGFLISILAPAMAIPCSCAFPTFEEQMKSSTAVFTGKVLASEHKDEDQLQIRLELLKRWKGPSDRFLSVWTPANTAACGFPFERDRVYLIYASGKDRLLVNLCSRTKLITEAKEDLDQLELTSRGRKDLQRDPFTQMKGDRTPTNKLVPRDLNITHAVIVGITRKSDAYVALIRATNNKVYFLKTGDKLHDGVVVKIDSNSVTFRQNRGSRSALIRKQLRPFPDN